MYGIALVRPAWPLVDYYQKMEIYLAQCKNKARPELSCNGQCVLMQKLQLLNDETEDTTPPSPAKVNLQDYPVGIMDITCLPEAFRKKSSLKHRKPIPWFTFFVIDEIFHPPVSFPPSKTT